MKTLTEALNIKRTVEDELLELERIMQSCKARKAELIDSLFAEAKAKELKKIDTDLATYSVVAPTTRMDFNDSLLKIEMPEIYEKYKKVTPVAECLKVKWKVATKPSAMARDTALDIVIE